MPRGPASKLVRFATTVPAMSVLNEKARRIVVSSPSDHPSNRSKASHWKNDRGTAFANPWASFQPVSGWDIAKFLWVKRQMDAVDTDQKNIDSLVPSVKATFGTAPSPLIQATWLGHAAFLIEMSAREGAERGVRVLFDPAFSNRCSPFQSFGGNVRMNAPPCPPEHLPEVDVIAISHNHYDHMDLPTLSTIYKSQVRPPALFLPLNNASYIPKDIPKASIVELDWWESREVDVGDLGKIRITCTPSQHGSARGAFDKDNGLWSSWAVTGLDHEGRQTGAVYFAGDTGYCTTHEETHEIRPELPVCPAFKEIGERLGPFDLGLLPIGAYQSRWPMSPLHVAPIEAVRMFHDLKLKRALGMHWGTWRMALDRIAEPAQLLVDARKVVGLTEEQFDVCALGETRAYEPARP